MPQIPDEKVEKIVKTRCILLLELFPSLEHSTKSLSSCHMLLCRALHSHKFSSIITEFGSDCHSCYAIDNKIVIIYNNGNTQTVDLTFLKNLKRNAVL